MKKSKFERSVQGKEETQQVERVAR